MARARQISFAVEIKRIFWAQYQAGEYIPSIFERLGYDPEILEIARMYSLASNLRKCVAEGREFTSGYTNRAKIHRRAEGKPACDASAMRHELIYLRQQLEFLKKLPSWAEGQSGGADDGQARQKAIRTNTVADNLLNRELEQHVPRKALPTDITYSLIAAFSAACPPSWTPLQSKSWRMSSAHPSNWTSFWRQSIF